MTGHKWFQVTKEENKIESIHTKVKELGILIDVKSYDMILSLLKSKVP